ncbi:hypothetical protein [Yoonia sp. BS5-3]|uniref:Outer membrane protein n=1 Tax=Yoonia phaeophyticola TaxID=3137369 RepID=A0ABZ2UZ27_9RHOB
MKNTLMTTATAAIVSSGSASYAQGAGDWYVSVFAGLSANTYTVDDYFGSGDDLDYIGDSYMIGVATGLPIAANVRGEVELSYSDYEFDEYAFDGGSVSLSDGFSQKATYLMGNAWYDLSSVGAGSAMPYVGGGLGVAFVETELFGYQLDSVATLAVQLGGGVQMPVGAGAIDIGYRFKALPGYDEKIDGTEFFSSSSSNISHNLQVAYVFAY